MRTAGEVTFADAHKQHANEGYIPSFIHLHDLRFEFISSCSDFSVVCFQSREDLERALDKLQGKEVNGRKLKLIDDSEKRDINAILTYPLEQEMFSPARLQREF
uniref:RRM domain-containing protein n=1 Tax=Parascaris equorum TaxID=6256 RepID=A0A914S6Q1_PAREQ